MKTFLFQSLFSLLLTGVVAVSFADAPIQWQPLCEPGGGGCIVALAISPHDTQHIVASGDMLGAAVSHDGGDSWIPCRGFSAYEMASITFHPSRQDELWLGSCMGPYRSTDGGRIWEVRRQGLPSAQPGRYTAMIEKVLVDPDSPNRILAFGGSSRHWNTCDSFGGIWESDNNGESWSFLGTLAGDTFHPAPRKGSNITRAFWDAQKTLHVVADARWWQSPDRGKTWILQRPSGLTGSLIGLTPHPSNPSILWASTDSASPPEGSQNRIPGGVYKSTDGGNTFSPCDATLPKHFSPDRNQSSWFKDVAVSAVAPDILYVCDQSWAQNVVYRSPDGGTTWSPIVRKEAIATATFAGPGLMLTAAEQTAGIIYGFNSEYILRTRDDGKTWDDATAYRPDPTRPEAWRGRGWNGWCCTDFEFNPYQKGQSVALAMDAGRGWLSDDDLHSWRYTMGQTHPWLGGNAVGFSRDGHIYITTGQFNDSNGIQHSSDGGKTWTTLAGNNRGLPSAGWGSGKVYGGIYVHPEKGRRAWVTLSGALLATHNAGETWAPVPGVTGASQIARDPSKTGRFYVKTREGVLVTDNGSDFLRLGFPTQDTRGRINCDASGRLLLCSWREGDAGLWRYDPKSRLWTRLLDEPLAYECNADPSDPMRLLLVTSDDPYHDQAHARGVWISVDDGATWSPANAGLPMLRNNACAFDPFDPERIVVGSYGGGFAIARWPKTYRPTGTRKGAPKTLEVTPEPLPKFKPLLQNGSMTQGAQIVAQWQNGVRDTSVFHSAPASLRVDAKGTAFQSFRGHAGETLRFAGFFKTSGGAKAQIAVQSFAKGYAQNKWQQLIYRQGDADWTPFEAEITLPEWTEWSEIKLYVEGENGAAWMDDLHEAGTPIDEGKPISESAEIRSSAPPRGKPWEPAWCIYDWRSVWADRHEAYKKQSQKGGIQLLALGDSITEGWGSRVQPFAQSIRPEWTGANYGIGGDSTRQLLWRIQHGELQGLSPAVILLAIGTNNLYTDQNGGSEEEIARGIQEILRLLRKQCPSSKILLLSVLPRQNAYFCERIYRLNRLLAQFAVPKEILWHDRTELFQVRPSEVRTDLFGPDLLHLKPEAYDTWEADLRPLLQELFP